MVTPRTEGRHEHGGRSSEGSYDDGEVLKWAGLRPGQVLVDIGCGNGHLSLAGALMVSREGKVHAFDVDRPSIDILRQKKEVYRLDNICVHEKDVTHGLDLEARSIDLVVLANVLHGFVHNSEWPPVLEEVARVLKPEGRLLTIEFRKDQTPFGPPLDLRLSVSELRDLLIGYGFTTSKTSDLGTAHYMALSVR